MTHVLRLSLTWFPTRALGTTQSEITGLITNISRRRCCSPIVGTLVSFHFRLNDISVFRFGSPRTAHARRTIYQGSLHGSHLVVNEVREPQVLRSRHASLVLCQLVQPLQSVFDVLLSNQLSHNFFWERLATMKDRGCQRTRSTLSHFLSCDREDVQHLDHYLHYDVRHRFCRRHGGISLEAFEEVLHALEEIDERILTGFNVLSRLRYTLL